MSKKVDLIIPDKISNIGSKIENLVGSEITNRVYHEVRARAQIVTYIAFDILSECDPFYVEYVIEELGTNLQKDLGSSNE